MTVKNSLFAAFPRVLRSHWQLSKIVMETVKTVLSGAIGVRSCRGALGAANLSPMYIVIGAIIFVVLFIITLLTIVHIVTS